MIVIKIKPFPITDSRADFDKACKDAYGFALAVFKIDEYGHSDSIDFNRSTDSIHVKFLSYKCIGSIVGHEHLYEFEAWIEREEEE